MRYVCTPPMFPNYFSALEKAEQPFSQLLYKAATTEFTVTVSVCFIRAAESCVSDLFLPSTVFARKGGGHLRINEGVSIPMSRKKNVNIFEQRLFSIVGDYGLNLVAALLAFTRANEINWAGLEPLDWYL